jgi:hypothetical protein
MKDVGNEDVIKKHPHSVFLTTSNIGLEGFASFIKDETWHKLATVLIPLLVAVVSFIIRRLIAHLDCKRGISTYNNIIGGLEEELQTPDLRPARKNQINKDIEKYKEDIIKLKKGNIKIFID